METLCLVLGEMMAEKTTQGYLQLAMELAETGLLVYAHVFYSCMTGIFRYTRTAADIRDHFANYLSSPIGEVSWQHAYINRTQ